MGDEERKPAFDEIDLSRHDFDALRRDVNDVVDIRRALTQTLRWAVGLPVVGVWLTWIVFADRMSVWIRVPYVILVAAGLLLAAVSIGGLMVMRTRVAEVDEAADRVITTVAALHSDYLQIRSGSAEWPKRELASLLTTELVFPALLAGGDTAFSTMSGPVGFLARPLLKYPMAMVENRVLEVIDQDDAEDDVLIAQPADLEVSSSEVVAAAVLADLPPELGRWYGSIHRNLTRVVGGAGTIAVGSMWTVVVAASTPVVVLLVFGWLLT
jgi:hypothetical protein